MLDRLLTFPTRRPWTVLAAAAALAGASVVGLARMPLSTSLEAMLDPSRPAVAALAAVVADFDTAGDLPVLASLPDGAEAGTEAGIAKLTAFAARLERAVADSPELSLLCRGATWRTGPEAAEFAANVIIPAGAYYLDDDGFAALRRRLTPAGMAEQLRRSETLMATPGPAGAALSRALRADPLGLREFIVERFAAAGNALRTFRDGPEFVSADGRHVLILLRGREPPTNLPYARRFTAAVRIAAAAVNHDGLTPALSGGYAIAAEAERRIRADSISNVFAALLMMQAIFWIAYRRLWSFALVAGPLVVGILWGFGAYSLLSPALTPLTAVIGGVLAGLGDDYAIHYLSHFETQRAAGADADEAARRTGRRLLPALVSAWGTSAAGFAVIALSSVQALRDFALIGALGLTGAFLASLTVMPALLKVTAGRAAPVDRFERRFGLGALTGAIERRRRPLIAAMVLLSAALVAVPLLRPDGAAAFESDLTPMHPEPNEPLATQRRIAAIYGGAPDALLVHLRAASAEALLSEAHRVQRALAEPEVGRAGAAAVLGPALFLPDPARTEARRAELRALDAERVVADFRAALAQSPFDPAAFEDYAQFLRRLPTVQRPPGLADLVRHPSLCDRFLPRAALRAGAAEPTEALVLIASREPLQDRAVRDALVAAVRAATADVPGATVTGMSAVGADGEAAVRRDLPVLLIAAAALNLIWLGVHLRRPADAALAVLPTGLGLAAAWAALCLLGHRWNPANLMVLPVLIGAGVDYGIFLVCLFRQTAGQTAAELRREIAAGVHALTATNLTTVVGFGTLYWTSTPAVRSFGVLTAIGIAACLAASLLLLLPILTARESLLASDRETTRASG